MSHNTRLVGIGLAILTATAMLVLPVLRPTITSAQRLAAAEEASGVYEAGAGVKRNFA